MEYVVGYFFRRLLHFHRDPCSTCSQHGTKFTKENVIIPSTQLFMCLKRYESDKATLYQCTEVFKIYSRRIVLLGKFCFAHIPDRKGIINLVTSTAMTHVKEAPKFCTANIHRRFVKLIARTIILNHLRWKNAELKSRGKGKRKRTTDPVSMKLSKLSHS